MNTCLLKLSKSIQFGDQLLTELKNKEQLTLEQMIIVSLYRKLIEQLDGNYILADHNFSGPLKVMMRASFETYLSLKYILHDEEHIQNRALSYYIGFIKSQLTAATEAQNNEYIELSQEEIQETIDMYSNILANQRFRDILTEWERTKDSNRRYRYYEPSWHALFNGPTSIKQILEAIGEGSDYLFYSFLSQEAHGYQALNGLMHPDLINNRFDLKPLRGVLEEELQELATSLCTTMTYKIIQNMLPEYADQYTQLRSKLENI